MTAQTALLLVLLLPAFGWGQSSGGPASAMAASCQPTPVQDSVSVMGPMVGSWPVWVADGPGAWGGANYPVKTLWVLARLGMRVEITGRLVSGGAVAQFRRGSGPLTTTLVVEDPVRESVIPGGATRDVLRTHTFIMSQVFYAVPGCWQFTVAIGGETHTIVRSLEAAP